MIIMKSVFRVSVSSYALLSSRNICLFIFFGLILFGKRLNLVDIE